MHRVAASPEIDVALVENEGYTLVESTLVKPTLSVKLCSVLRAILLGVILHNMLENMLI